MPQTQTNFDKPYDQPLPAATENRQSLASPANKKDSDYQSILLTRFLKEPRLPPSSNYIKQKSVGRKPLNKLNHTTNNEYKTEEKKGKKGYKQPVISYRNQSEIMKKIFGNEQNYHQVKNLLKQEDKYQSTYQQMLVKQQELQTKQQIRIQHSQEQNQQSVQNQQRTMSSPNNKVSFFYNERKTIDATPHQNNNNDQIILARSHMQKIPENQDEKLSGKPLPSGPSDQVEKAIFDLQDVKNNYFQEKSNIDHKIQQIQLKQNQTQANGFFNQQTRTATSGFFTGSGRPMTQGSLFKNQSLINDNNVLKSDLEQVSKEDLKERLVVAEMVMKKLFQRNKDLEEQLQSKVVTEEFDEGSPEQQTTKSMTTQEKQSEIKMSISEDCKNCLELRKEMATQENQSQAKINDLELQLLKATASTSKSSHNKYLQQRLEETMAEAKRHFTNYMNLRNSYNNFLESRLNLAQISGGTKGQKLQSDILSMLKKNLEQSELALKEEQDSLKLSYHHNTFIQQIYLQLMKIRYQKLQTNIQRKDETIIKKEKNIAQMREEIERRQFLEAKVQRYVKGIIAQNQKCKQFIESIKQNLSDNSIRFRIDNFLTEIDAKEYDENEGESTENENQDDDIDNNEEQSVEVNDI